MHLQTASLVQFQFYRKQEFYRFFALITLVPLWIFYKKQLLVPFYLILANNDVYTIVWCCFYGYKV